MKSVFLSVVLLIAFVLMSVAGPVRECLTVIQYGAFAGIQ